MKKSLTKRRKSLLKTKERGFISLLLPILGAFGTLGGEAAGTTNAVSDAKVNEKHLSEMKRYNLILQSEKYAKKIKISRF